MARELTNKPRPKLKLWNAHQKVNVVSDIGIAINSHAEFFGRCMDDGIDFSVGRGGSEASLACSQNYMYRKA